MSKQLTRERLVADLRQFAADLGKSPTRTELNEYGPHYGKLYQKEFGTWNDALQAAGLEPNLVHNVSRSDLLADIERVAGVLGKSPTLNEMDEYGEYSKLTYSRKLGSYVEALEELGLEPSVRQYNFSSQEKPPRLRATQNVRKLRENGPTAVSDLPQRSVGAQDKRYGLTKFSVSTGQTGQGQAETVYYLFDEHDPEAVVRKFLELNPQLLENRTRKAIVEDVGNHGRSWSAAIRTVLDERSFE